MSGGAQLTPMQSRMLPALAGIVSSASGKLPALAALEGAKDALARGDVDQARETLAQLLEPPASAPFSLAAARLMRACPGVPAPDRRLGALVLLPKQGGTDAFAIYESGECRAYLADFPDNASLTMEADFEVHGQAVCDAILAAGAQEVQTSSEMLAGLDPPYGLVFTVRHDLGASLAGPAGEDAARLAQALMRQMIVAQARVSKRLRQGGSA